MIFRNFSIEEIRKGITLEELKKATALELHNQAYKEQAIYNLPYRIVYDYHYNRIYDYDNYAVYESQVPLSVSYPLLGIPAQGKWKYDTDGHYTAEEWEQITAVYITCKDGKVVKDIINKRIPPEIQNLIDDKTKQYSLCNMETAAGLQAWVYYFMVFIMPYADTIKDFTQFDMFGDTGHTDQELNERKQYYMDLIKQCQEQPKLYKAAIVKQGTDNLSILYSERDTMPYYKRECSHKDTMQYRLKWLISLYEQE